MAGFVKHLLVCTLGMSLLAALLLLLEKPMDKRYAPGGRYALWVAVLLGFLVIWRPPVLRIPLPQQDMVLPQEAQPLHQGTKAEAAPPVAKVQPTRLQVAAEPSAPAAPAAKAGPAFRLSAGDGLLLLYGLGALAVLLAAAIRHLQFLRHVKRWGRPVKEGPLWDILLQKKEELAISAPLPLVLCPAADSPMLVGLAKPRLLLPSSTYTKEELLLIYHHELIHYQRRDLWIKYLSVLALSLHWFNPFAWLAAHRAAYHCETSCDQRVVQQQDIALRARYSHTILNGLQRARQGTALSTGFTGGKNDMKNRIMAIMEGPRGKKGWLPLAAACLVMLLSGFTLAESAPAPQKGFPKEAYIHSPIASSAGLCEISDDYEIPAAVYFNGTRVRVTEIEKSRGGYPNSLDDPTEMWGHVVVQAGGKDTFISGWVPQVCLQYIEGDTAAPGALPTGTLAVDTPLYTDNGLTQNTLGDYKKGTPLTLLGSMLKYHHVVMDGKVGFIPVDALKVDEGSAANVEKGQPEVGIFGDIMPGHLERYREYQEKLAAIMGVLDNETMNPSLENMAARSALALEYGYKYMDVINIVPGEQDMKPEAVAALGEKLLRDKYGYTDQDIMGVGVRYYYRPEDPATHYWKVGIYAQYPVGNSTVELSVKGEPLTYFKAEDGKPRQQEEQPTEEEIKQAQQGIDYYLNHFYDSYPKEGDMQREQALTLAWQRMGEVAQGIGFSRAEYEVWSMSFHRHNRDNIAWWRVDFKLKGQEIGNDPFFVAVTSPEGNIISADKEGFAHDMQVAAYQQSYQESEKKWGPSNTWTAEVAAKAQPWDFAPPPTEGILLEEALDIARNYLLTTESIPQETLDTWHPQALFTVEDKWYIMFHTDETLKDPELPCYTVRVDHQDGGIELISDFNTNG